MRQRNTKPQGEREKRGNEQREKLTQKQKYRGRVKQKDMETMIFREKKKTTGRVLK